MSSESGAAVKSGGCCTPKVPQLEVASVVNQGDSAGPKAGGGCCGPKSSAATACCGPTKGNGSDITMPSNTTDVTGAVLNTAASVGNQGGSAGPKAGGGCCGPKSKAATTCCGPTKSNGSDSTMASKTTDVTGAVLKTAATSCCAPAPAPSSAAHSGVRAPSACCGPAPAVAHEDVQEYYGKTLQKSDDLLTNACVLQGSLGADTRQLLANVHPSIIERFYGCGSPIPPSLSAATVVDLGCGTGRDVFVVAQLVGEKGRVIGIDMTEEQLAVAREYEDWHRTKFGYETSNTDFRKAFIEDLAAAGIPDSSVDVVISNCVLNLAPDKAPVLAEVARVLKPGGELYFSDIYADRRIPDELRKDKVLFGECLSGALYLSDFRRLMASAGLGAWGVVSKQPVGIANDDVQKKVGPLHFFSLTVRAVKLAADDASAGEDSLEDYGQMATYKGTIDGHPHAFVLDEERCFITGVPTPVDSTTAAVLSTSRYHAAFKVSAQGPHMGAFTKWKKPLACYPGYVLCDQ